jgi:hypothetical protein
MSHLELATGKMVLALFEVTVVMFHLAHSRQTVDVSSQAQRTKQSESGMSGQARC